MYTCKSVQQRLKDIGTPKDFGYQFERHNPKSGCTENCMLWKRKALLGSFVCQSFQHNRIPKPTLFYYLTWTKKKIIKNRLWHIYFRSAMGGLCGAERRPTTSERHRVPLKEWRAQYVISPQSLFATIILECRPQSWFSLSSLISCSRW